MMVANFAWVVRADMRAAVGGGHVMRSLALAEAMMEYAPVVFAIDPDGADWADKIAARGITAIEEDKLGDGPWAGVVLDGYGFSRTEQSRWKQRCGRLVVLDDVTAPSADLVLLPGAPEATDKNEDTPVLGGPKYALLGRQYRKEPRLRDGAIRSILLSFGLRDSAGATVLAMSALAALAASQFEPEIVVALGSGSPVLDAVNEAGAALGNRCRIELDLPDLYENYARADLALGAGGIGLLERLAAGLPSLNVIIAQNQRAGVEGFAAAAATLDAGPIEALDEEMLASMIAKLAADPLRRAGLARKGRALVDGRGAERAASAICELSGANRRQRAAGGRLR